MLRGFLNASLILALLGVAMFFFAACGSAPDSSEGGGRPSSVGVEAVTALHPQLLPRVVNQGGPVLTHPKFMAVTFSGDSLADSIETFMSRFSVSSEFSAMTSEYGVGSAQSETPVRLSESAPVSIDDSGIQTWLTSKLHDSRHILGIPNSQTVYVLYYPQATSIAAEGGHSCTDFDGYHKSFVDADSGQTILYVVLARCSGGTIQDLTATTSHELVEVATDPDFDDNAFNGVYSDSAIWTTLGDGSEVSDLCQNYDTSYYAPSDLGFKIQRSWSNVAAANGHDPCVPVLPQESYFNAAPILTDSVTYVDSGHTITTRGVRIPVGSSRTIEIELMGDSRASAIAVDAFESGASGNLGFSFSKSSGAVGDRIQLTITVHHKNPTYNAEPFWIETTVHGVSHYWPVVVGN